MKRLEGKYVLITGSGGIGMQTTIKLLNEGVAGLSVIEVRDEALKDAEAVLKPLAEKTRAKLVLIKANVAIEEEVKEYVRKTMEAFDGRLDIRLAMAKRMKQNTEGNYQYTECRRLGSNDRLAGYK